MTSVASRSAGIPGQLDFFVPAPVLPAIAAPEVNEEGRPARRTPGASPFGRSEKTRVPHFHRDLLALLAQPYERRPGFLLEGERVSNEVLDEWLRDQLGVGRRWLRVSGHCETFSLEDGCLCPQEWQKPWWAQSRDFRRFGETFPDGPAQPGTET